MYLAQFLFNVCSRSKFSPMEGEGMDEEMTNPMVENEPCDLSEICAAQKVQKVYRSYRTRRRLADSAVVAEEFWSVILSLYCGTFATIYFVTFISSFTSLLFVVFGKFLILFNSKPRSFCFGI
jgi:hypothetical protein